MTMKPKRDYILHIVAERGFFVGESSFHPQRHWYWAHSGAAEDCAECRKPVMTNSLVTVAKYPSREAATEAAKAFGSAVRVGYIEIG